jgi:hypothetical protein
MRCNVMQCNAMQRNAMWRNATKCVKMQIDPLFCPWSHCLLPDSQNGTMDAKKSVETTFHMWGILQFKFDETYLHEQLHGPRTILSRIWCEWWSWSCRPQSQSDEWVGSASFHQKCWSCCRKWSVRQSNDQWLASYRLFSKINKMPKWGKNIH